MASQARFETLRVEGPHGIAEDAICNALGYVPFRKPRSLPSRFDGLGEKDGGSGER